MMPGRSWDNESGAGADMVGARQQRQSMVLQLQPAFDNDAVAPEAVFASGRTHTLYMALLEAK